MPRPPYMAQTPPETRLGRPVFDEEVASVYRRALDVLDDAKDRIAVGGALALNAYTGIWRDTKDLDLFCRPEDAVELLERLDDHGFETQVVYESWLGKAWIGDVFVDFIWRNANALFPVHDGWFPETSGIDLLGHRLRVIPIEHLIASKMMVCGRYRFDGADIMHLVYSAHDRIDWNVLEEVVGEHLELLLAHLHMYRWAYPGWADRVPDEILERYHRLAQERASSYGPFRAKLLDIQTFSVDVDEWGMPDPHRQALADIFGTAEGRT